MRNSLVIVIILSIFPAYSQVGDTSKVKYTQIQSSYIDFPEVNADFVGGIMALQTWIAKNIEYPKDALNKNEQGCVNVAFLVEADGTISEVEVMTHVSASLDQEAIRLVQLMPKWIPAELDEKKIRSSVVLPINFTLTNSGKKSKRG